MRYALNDGSIVRSESAPAPGRIPSHDPFARFNSPLHLQWKQDRLLRQRVPLHQAWRGFLGLAALIEGIDDVLFCGPHAFYRNEQVTWLALRDVPAGHFPASPSMNGREVSWANAAKATLRYGMPCLDFAVPDRNAVDFRFIPCGTSGGDVLDPADRQREFAVLNRLSAVMTDAAFHGVDATGRPWRRCWYERRPDLRRRVKLLPPHSWMPRPYLLFPMNERLTLMGLIRASIGLGSTRRDQVRWEDAFQRLISPASDYELLLCPAKFAGYAMKDRAPLGLWWDFGAAGKLDLFDMEAEAAIFPPLPLRRWDSLSIEMPGAVLLDAAVTDPRLRVGDEHGTQTLRRPRGPVPANRRTAPPRAVAA